MILSHKQIIHEYVLETFRKYIKQTNLYMATSGT